METFQPNSIRSLLNKRNSKITKIQNQDGQQSKIESLSKTTSNFNKTKIKKNDPDLDSILQAKLMIKDIDHDIDSIRTWRQHQRQILQQKFRSNQELSKLSRQQYIKLIDKQLIEDQLENSKLIQKLRLQQQKLKKPYNSQDHNDQKNQNDSLNESQLVDSEPYIFYYINQAQKKVQSSKYNNYQTAIDDKHEALITDMHNMSEIFTKKNQQVEQQCAKGHHYQNQEKKQQTKIKKILLKQQLQDIQKQLKEMEELLKD